MELFCGGGSVANGLIDKLSNFLMPVEDDEAGRLSATDRSRKVPLQVHSLSSLKVFVALPRADSEICYLADCLKTKMSIIVNYSQVTPAMQQTIHDFLSGVCYVTQGTHQRISEQVYMYLPEHAEFDKRLFAATIPTYVKKKN